jgi:hypothetical protein
LELFPSPRRLLDVTPAGQQCDFPLQGYVEKTGSTSSTVSVCPSGTNEEIVRIGSCKRTRVGECSFFFLFFFCATRGMKCLRGIASNLIDSYAPFLLLGSVWSFSMGIWVPPPLNSVVDRQANESMIPTYLTYLVIGSKLQPSREGKRPAIERRMPGCVPACR